MPYQYDIFISYKRDPLTLDWHREVVKRIAHYVKLELNSPQLKFFFDEASIETGDSWKEDIKAAIKNSKCLVAIWSPDYFNSNWCLTEFYSFLKRQELLNKRLIISASYHDGECFPQSARDIQFRDFSDYGSTLKVFWETKEALEFEKKLKEFSKDIASKIKKAPDHNEDFPFVINKEQLTPQVIERIN